MLIKMNLNENSYDILVERGAINSVSKNIDTNRKVMIVSDTGVPNEYAEIVASQCKESVIAKFKEGEKNKNIDNYQCLLKKLIENNFTRSDCIIAVGGGVVGDLAGFVASSYMRGIDFYNIPTTLLSQIDSSIGGKVAIDFNGVKNIVGAFYQPKMVIIDPNTLQTLEKRQIANGLAEAIKMSMTSDKDLFSLIKEKDIEENIDEIIIRSLNIKKSVVEKDEKENNLRKVLNFGHTIGHGIEIEQNGNLYHGECVALGMIPMCSKNVKEELIYVLKKVGLPTEIKFSKNVAFDAIKHDKKFKGNKITLIKVNEIGAYSMENANLEDVNNLLSVLEG